MSPLVYFMTHKEKGSYGIYYTDVGVLMISHSFKILFFCLHIFGYPYKLIIKSSDSFLNMYLCKLHIYLGLY